VDQTLVYLIPILFFITAIKTHSFFLGLISAKAMILMLITYYPITHHYAGTLLHTLSLPVTALFYLLMTIDSAWRHWRGRGGQWKGRKY